MEYRLITAVSGFPCLYDRSSPTYRDLNMRSDALEGAERSFRRAAAGVREDAGALTGPLVPPPEPDCRRKWKMLRDQHRRERYREREAARRPAWGLLNYRPWRYAAILSFLNPFTDSRAAGTNGWALEPRGAQPDLVGCSDDDDSYGEPPPRPRPRRDQQVLDPLSSAASPWPSPTPPPPPPPRAPRRPSGSARRPSAPQTSGRRRPGWSGPRRRRRSAGRREGAVRDHDAGGDVPGRVAGRAALLALRRRRLAAAEDRGAGRQRRRAAGAHRRRGRVAPGGRAAAGGPPTARWRTGPGARSPGGTRGWSSRDHVTLFLLSLAPAVRRLPAEKQSWLKTKIQQLVHEAEFGPTSFQ
ncbi:unnamed protein product [Tetraodon nigroviridis]|uniref:(spotted green pufferfish) hypothetical protein n=1 Tax=Tetraodon nigroviridis TaxID=99883 RepID=Q4TAZ6_TETNG|nr:unnamed protein product [Tetraodon nigroviridis]